MNGSSVIILSVALLTYSVVSLAQTPQSAHDEPQTLVQLLTPESQIITTVISVPSSTPRSPQEVLRDYESAVRGISQKFLETVAAVAQAVQNGQLSRKEGEEVSAEQYQTARMQLEVLTAGHDMLAQDLAPREAAHRNMMPSRDDETVIVALPFSSLELDPSLVAYLGLSLGQIRAIQNLMSQERRNVEPFMKQLRSEQGKLLAATDPGQANEKQVQTRATAEASMLSNLLVENAHMQAKLYRLLTREQRRKLDYLKVSGER